jgi:hypothetical protein
MKKQYKETIMLNLHAQELKRKELYENVKIELALASNKVQ